MDKKERAELIRKGNEFFNKGDITKAMEIFVKTGYRDGLTRIGDHYYYDLRQPLVAIKFYKMADVKPKVDEIYTRMIMALGKWLGKDDPGKAGMKVTLPPLKVSPKLKILAEEILRNQNDGN